MARELKSKVVILADDRTGQAFNSVAAKLRQLASSSKQVKAVTTQVDAVRTAMSRYQKTGDDLGKIRVFREAARGALELGRSHREALTHLRSVSREMNIIGPPTAAMSARYRQAQESMRSVGRALREQKEAVATARDALSSAGINVDRLASAQRRLELATKGATAAARAQAANPWGQASRQRHVEAKPHGAGVAGIGGLPAAYYARQGALKAIDAGKSMDFAVRRQRAFADLSESEQNKILIPQAEKIGRETKFTNIDVVEAQTTTANRLPAHMKNAETIAPLVGQMKNYAMSMKEVNMDEASQAVTGFLLSTGKDISTPEKADFEARRASNLLIRSSKLGAMGHHDLMPFVQRGLSAGNIAGLSDETMLAMGVGLKRSNISGDQAGTALRTISSKLVAPTNKGLAALATAGIDYSKYSKMPQGLSVESLEGKFKQDFGKSFTPEVREKLGEALGDSEIVGDRGRFTQAVTDAVAELFTPKKDGTMRASDRQAVAKKVGEFHKFSAESVDSEGLLRAILAKDPTLGVLNAFATDKHGNKLGLISKGFEQFERDRETLRETPGDFGDKIAATITGGLGGALDRLTGSIETAYQKIGTANAGWLTPSVDAIGNAIEALSQLPPKLIVFGTAVATASGVLLGIKGASTAATVAGAAATTVRATAAGATLTKAGSIGSTFARFGARTLGVAGLAYGGYELLDYAIGQHNREKYKDVAPGEAHNEGRNRRRAYHEALRQQTAGVRAQHAPTLADAGIVPLGKSAGPKFGLGASGEPVGQAAPLRLGAGGPIPNLADALKGANIEAKLEGSAEVKLSGQISLEPGLMAKLNQTIAAVGNLKAGAASVTAAGSTGKTMTEASGE
jgi:hypothetical protein